MKRKEFKEKLFDALKSDVDNMSYDEKMILVNNLLIDFEKRMNICGTRQIRGGNGKMKIN